jgi:hypothetical protein
LSSTNIHAKERMSRYRQAQHGNAQEQDGIVTNQLSVCADNHRCHQKDGLDEQQPHR